MVCFVFIVTATTEIYTLSLHDALPILETPVRMTSMGEASLGALWMKSTTPCGSSRALIRRFLSSSSCARVGNWPRSEEHTSELQSHSDLVCRLLLEKKKTKKPGLH